MVKLIKSYYREQKNCSKKFQGNLFVTSSSSHFFNKTNFEQYLFNMKYLKWVVIRNPSPTKHCVTNIDAQH